MDVNMNKKFKTEMGTKPVLGHINHNIAKRKLEKISQSSVKDPIEIMKDARIKKEN